MDKEFCLYMFPGCPFYQRVNRFLTDNSITLEQRNIRENPTFRDELIAGGGKSQIPCLRIEDSENNVEWLYESADIIDYLADIYKIK